MLAFYGIIFVLFPILSTPIGFLGLLIDKKHYKFYIIGIVFNLAIIGYYFVPPEIFDLYRHFQRMNFLEMLSIKEVFNMYSTDPLILKNIWFYIVSLTNNYSLLPFSAILISYYIVLRDINKFGIKEKIPSGVIVSCILLVIVWWQLIWIMSGIRFPAAIALFFHGLFREYIEEKKNLKTYIFYIIPLFLHYSVFILVAFRIGIYFFKKFKKISILMLLLWSFFSSIVLNLLTLINIPYISGVAEKSKVYLLWSDATNFIIVNNFFKLFLCIIFVLAYIYLKRAYYNFFSKYQDFYYFGLLISLFCIGGTSISIILDRFGYFVLFMLTFLMMPIVNKKTNKLLVQLICLMYIVLLTIGLIFQYTTLKGTFYEITLLEFLSKNVIDLLIK